MQRQRLQSPIFILDPIKITHLGCCSTSGVWGSRSWLFFHRDGDSILSTSTCHPAPLYDQETCSAERGVIPTVPDFYLSNASLMQMARPPARQGTAHSA
ncbi:hypothetical protein Zmor_007912 [Zophobas morio]|uniref:Uncharacterized protein n=1 Tax=Zophobas morio TaxID=2755281 RepID=A0AA38MP76_9CUCU|nr:hypothetical protein Zmor_007912 [Zophobas morio]